MWRLRTSKGQFLTLRRLPATLGSERGADVLLPHASVEPLHARFRRGDDDSLVVEAMGDAIVGRQGKRVRTASFHDGDEIVLGRLRFTVVQDLAATPAPTPADAAPAKKPGLPPRRAKSASAPRERAGTRDEASALEGRDLALRGKALYSSRPPARRGLLHADLSQMAGSQRLLLLLIVLAVGAGLVWGVSLLTGFAG